VKHEIEKVIEKWTVETVAGIHSPILKRDVKIEIFLPPDYSAEKGPYPLLLLNDGQDSEAVKVKEALEKLYSGHKIVPLIVVGVSAGDRMQEYGVSGKPDSRKRGSKAKLYTSFIIQNLLPWLEYRYAVKAKSDANAIAGYSLGGLSAVDIAWHHPEIFKKAGAFSGSFWWRKRDLDKGYSDTDRIMHSVISKSVQRKGMKFWFQAGTEDEKADRNFNGIIDAIDDTVDLIGELIKKGYKPYYDVIYHEMKGGRHNQKTWSEAMPVFLEWAFHPVDKG